MARKIHPEPHHHWSASGGIVSTRFVGPTELIQIQDSRVRYVHVDAFGRSTEDRPFFGSGKKIITENYYRKICFSVIK